MGRDISKIRFVYVNATKHLSFYTGDPMFEVTLDVHEALNIPEGVSVQEACALASFLSLKIERENNLEEGDPRGIKLVVENLKKFGFTPNEESKSGHYHLTYEYSLAKKYNLDEECPELDSCLDLFVVDGDFKMFKKTNLSDRYEEWFTPVIEPKKVSKKR